MPYRIPFNLNYQSNQTTAISNRFKANSIKYGHNNVDRQMTFNRIVNRIRIKWCVSVCMYIVYRPKQLTFGLFVFLFNKVCYCCLYYILVPLFYGLYEKVYWRELNIPINRITAAWFSIYFHRRHNHSLVDVSVWNIKKATFPSVTLTTNCTYLKWRTSGTIFYF